MGAWEAWESPEFLGWKWAWGCGKWSQEDNYQVSFLWSYWVSSAKTNSLGSGCQIQTGQWEEEALIQSWSVWQRRQCKESSNREEGRQAKNDPWENNTATNSSLTWFLSQPKEGIYPEVTNAAGDWTLVRSQSSLSSWDWINIHFHFLLFLLLEILHVILKSLCLDYCIHIYGWDWFILC